MTKTTAEKIANREEKIQQLMNERKQLIQKHKKEERAARTKRLCSRHGLLEKYMPDLITITDEQFEMFIKRGINTSYGQKTLAEIKAKSGATATPLNPNTATQPTELTAAKPTQTAQGNNFVEPARMGGVERKSG